MPGTLYVVATPIGNLGDLTRRATEVLGSVALVAAEDTRVTRRLLAHLGLHPPLVSCHAHSGPGRLRELLERLLAGDDVALVTDAGTPGISDPGGDLVRAALGEGIPVVPVPGPSAVTAALAASGLDPSRFVFEGFLPRGGTARRRALERLRNLPHTLVFFEAANRVPATLQELREVLGDRDAVLARELTKRFEEFRRGPLSVLAAGAAEETPRGECVVLVAGAGEGPPLPENAVVKARLHELLDAGHSPRDASHQAAAELGAPRNLAYSLVQELLAHRPHGPGTVPDAAPAPPPAPRAETGGDTPQ